TSCLVTDDNSIFPNRGINLLRIVSSRTIREEYLNIGRIVDFHVAASAPNVITVRCCVLACAMRSLRTSTAFFLETAPNDSQRYTRRLPPSGMISVSRHRIVNPLPRLIRQPLP